MGRKSRFEYLAENDYDWNMQKTDKKYREYMKKELELVEEWPDYNDPAEAILTISREVLDSRVTNLEEQVEALGKENEKLRERLNANHKANTAILKALEMIL